MLQTKRAKAGLAIAVIATISLGGTAASYASLSSPTLAVSSNADRSQATHLQHASLTGNAYIFVDKPNALEVDFYLDDPMGKSSPYQVEKTAPFDLAATASSGNANPFDTTKLSNGKHGIRAVVKSKHQTKVFSARFTVKNGSTPPVTTTTIKPTTTTVKPTTTTTVTVPPTTTTTVKPTTTTTVTVPPTTTTTIATNGNCANPTNPWATLEACGWPGPSNTGYDVTQCPNGLTTNSGSTTRVIDVTQDNTVINCQRITGSLDIQAKNVTVKNSYVSYDGGGVGGSGVIKIEDGASATVDHVEINGLNHTHACVWHQGTAMTVKNINCYGINDGIFSWADTGYSATTGDNFSISDSYFHNFTSNAANGHIDGYQTEGANNGLISHNTYLMGVTANDDSAIAIWDSLKSSSNITVQNNLMTGGGFTVYAEDYNPSESSPGGGFSVTNISFLNNSFSTKGAGSGCVGSFGVWYYRASLTPLNGGPTDGWHRTGNKVLETGENVDNGNPHVNGNLCS